MGAPGEQMKRAGSWITFAAGAVGLCAGAAQAQTVDERYSGLELRPTLLPGIFSAAAPQPTPAPAGVPIPRPAPRTAAARRIPAAAKANMPVARQEELLVSSYNAVPAPTGTVDERLVSWLPRLAPVAPEPPATAPVATPVAAAPAAPPPTGGIISNTFRSIVGEPPAWNGQIRARPVPRDLDALIAAKAHKHGVPLPLAHAFVTVESNYNPTLIGKGATLGLMQIKHPTAQGMGFAGTPEELMDPATNLEWGMRYLAGARKLARGDVCGTVLRYQAGHRAIEMTPAASVYCAKVQTLLAARTSPKVLAEMPAGR